VRDIQLQLKHGNSQIKRINLKLLNRDIFKIIETNIVQFRFINLKQNHIMLKDIAIAAQEIAIVFMLQTMNRLLYN